MVANQQATTLPKRRRKIERGLRRWSTFATAPLAAPQSTVGRCQRFELQLGRRQRVGYRSEEELSGYLNSTEAAHQWGCSVQYLTRLARIGHPSIRNVRRFRSLGAGNNGWRWNFWDLVYARQTR